ncbi:hypothetical protein L6164_023431 [Bauhinia variegata]|uniref:Uncharacterized protein n=1 Tax=Bauhinia variegata TaxID=167791 RepID=A0ACB9MIM7_BAUVA|nr:hypothetical protein L6164_023431 [Bauhinia variegata]
METKLQTSNTRYKRKSHCINLDDDFEEELSDTGNNSKPVEGKDEIVNDCSNNADSKDLSKITIEEFKMKEFNSEHEAYLFYLDYSKCVGFGVRRDDSGREKNGTYIWQRYVCVCEGKARKKQTECIEPKRRPRANKRTGSLAYLKVKLNIETSKWYVYNFEPNHNHALVLPSYSHLIPSHRIMTDADKALINSMLGRGLKASTTMDFMTGLAGGPDKVGFTRKDLYNYAEKQRKMKVSEGDAHSALNYLQGKADSDPKFFVRHTTDDEGCLENLFWCDGHSQFDYECFGEVIAFDTTYKINKYNKPFVMFTGVNHHGNNIIFASALLVDESKDTYIWVLEKLMEVMQDKKPYAVVTDGDKAMRKAIEVVFPDACHRLCTWHLAKNIHSDKFTQEMSRCIYVNVDIETFEGNESNSSFDGDIADNSAPISSDHVESPSTFSDMKLAQVSTAMTQSFARYGSPLTYHGFPQSASSLLGAMQVTKCGRLVAVIVKIQRVWVVTILMLFIGDIESERGEEWYFFNLRDRKYPTGRLLSKEIIYSLIDESCVISAIDGRLASLESSDRDECEIAIEASGHMGSWLPNDTWLSCPPVMVDGDLLKTIDYKYND